MFDIIPRKLSIDASAASWIIEENHAFDAFLKRESALEQADACLRVLGGDPRVLQAPPQTLPHFKCFADQPKLTYRARALGRGDQLGRAWRRFGQR